MILRTAALLTVAFLLTLAAVPTAAAEELALLNRGHEGWQYWDKGEHPPEAWNTNDFDDTGWDRGTAPLGYGVDGIATTISFGENAKNKHPVTFFRRKFQVDDPGDRPVWVGELRCDDGAAVYLNGKEIFRYNMPTGDLAVATFASGTLSGKRKSGYRTFFIDGGHLTAGENVLAISVHQADAGSSDLVMDFALKGAAKASVPEAMTLQSDGVFKEDTEISKYIGRWARHLLKQDHTPNPTRLASGLGRILDRELDLIETSETPLSPEELYEQCVPGVLIISSVTEASNGPISHASGFVISSDGLALTNFHVMASAGQKDFVATTVGGRVVRVKEIVAANQGADVALIQLDGDGFHPLPIAKSAPVGSELVAISHPAGSSGLMNEFFTLTKGHLARHRTFFGRHRIMVASAYSAGSSGAPILDRFGCVSGMASQSRSFVANRFPVHEKDGVLKLGKGESYRGLHIPMNHQMALGVAVPCQSIRAVLTPPPPGPAQNVEAPNLGLNWQLYEGRWDALPDFATLEPIDQGTCYLPRNDVHRGPADEFALVFSGFIDLPKDGAWQFRTTSDDGSRLFIDGELVVDNDGVQAAVSRSGSRRLAAGLHAIRIEYFDQGGPDELKVQFSGPGQPRSEIPISAFRRPAVPEQVTGISLTRLGEILSGEDPETIDEMRALQGHVQWLAERVLPATILLSEAGQPSGSSGVLVQRDGRNYVLSAAHSTRSAGRKMTIWMPDGSQLPAVTMGADRKIDVGLVQLETDSELPAVEMGTSTDLERGQWVAMLGHPSGRKPGRTAPVRLGRVLGVAESGFVITDCTMQGGDSGGPLFDMKGRLVGINSFCTPNLAVNAHGPIDPLVEHWEEFHDGKVIESTSPNKTKVSTSGVLLARSLSQCDAIRKPWASRVETANSSIVKVLVGGEERALGTVVADDLIVTKYSEIADEDKNVERTCKQGDRSWAYSIVGYEYSSDLALLRIDDGQLEPIVWQDATLNVGSFLASPGGASAPIGVGILSAMRYQHTQPHIKFGAWFKNSFDGQPELQGAPKKGAAYLAGLRVGDVVLQCGQERIDNAQQLMRSISQRLVGDKVEVTVRREDAEMTFEVKLGDYRRTERIGQEVVWGPLSDVRTGFEIVLQHDTVLKPEHCGGPLIDLKGRAIGLNIARAGRVETLALPASEVQRIVASLIALSRDADPASQERGGKSLTDDDERVENLSD